MAATLWLAAGCATTGEVRGRLVPPGPPPSSASPPAGRSSSPGSIADAVVYVEAPACERRAPAAHRRHAKPAPRLVNVTSRGFEPRVLAVTPGTTVRFRNRDRVYHTPFSLSPAARFDLQACAPGQTRSVVLDSLGAVHVYCELHPAAAGYVLVLPDRLYVRPGPNGRFRLPRVPPGPCTVRAWHPLYGEVARRVEVRRGRPAEIELAF